MKGIESREPPAIGMHIGHRGNSLSIADEVDQREDVEVWVSVPLAGLKS